MSISFLCKCFIIFKQSFIIVKFFKPRKSIFNKPAFSTALLSYCVTKRSESLDVKTGMVLTRLSDVIMIPHA